jgi:hypothetical protein
LSVENINAVERIAKILIGCGGKYFEVTRQVDKKASGGKNQRSTR